MRILLLGMPGAGKSEVARIFEKDGADIWFDLPAKELLPPGTRCRQCQGEEFSKEKDILDVWFDSGVSFAGVLETDPALRFPDAVHAGVEDQVLADGQPVPEAGRFGEESDPAPQRRSGRRGHRHTADGDGARAQRLAVRRAQGGGSAREVGNGGAARIGVAGRQHQRAGAGEDAPFRARARVACPATEDYRLVLNESARQRRRKNRR